MSLITLPRTYDIALFSSQNLTTDIAIEAAISELERKLNESSFPWLIDKILSQPNLLEFVISVTNGKSPFTQLILDTFPDAPHEFVGSIAAEILSKLALSNLFLQINLPEDIARSIKNHSQTVDIAPQCLHTILTMCAGDADFNLLGDEYEGGENVWLGVNNETRRTRAAKHSKPLNLAVDLSLFRSLGYFIPTSRKDAEDVARDIIKEQRQILQHFFYALRLPELSAKIRGAYIPSYELLEQDETKGIPAFVKTNHREITKSDKPSNKPHTSAYPMVQPMKAALYFESIKGFGDWRILISSRADKNLRNARRNDAKSFKIIIKKIRELSNGHFSADNQKRLNGANAEIPIFEAKMTRDLRLVYHIDCIPEYDKDLEVQVIKIYGIYTHAQLDGRFWISVGHQLAKKGKEYRKRCNFRNGSHRGGDRVVLPGSFPPANDLVFSQVSEGPSHDLPLDDLSEIHSLLVLEKFVTLSQALLYSMLADQDVQHVFSVSRQEQEIIEHQYSCYVLGRSGTGKTTTMLFKMLGIERAWDLRGDDMPKLRQVFVTQSRVLAGKVEEYFSKLMESLSTASKSPQELIEIAKAQKYIREKAALVDIDDDINWRSDLPAQFSLLRDEHFPLFITFDSLCKLLEADIGEDLRPRVRWEAEEDVIVSELQEPNPATISIAQANNARKYVSYSVFLRSYWPHFPHTLTKGLDSSMVFSEFIGVIKGSEDALAHPDGFLDKRGYEYLSNRTQSTFVTQRSTVYSLFQSYLRLKRERSDYDAADRTMALLKSLQKSGVPGQKMDYLYVDEAQDNLLIDALVLRTLCKNPHGLFWAGDTAQTISVGSSFRFDDLKAFLFRVEQKRQERNEQRSFIQPMTEEPRMFQLAVNYRSHGGIVNCAHSVIELIAKFWPYTIDILAQETGIVDGPKPIFLSGRDHNSAMYGQFIFGTKDSHIEFGAQQCIIVRDDAARNKIREQVGDVGLIMTPYESKGLEFNDVLLYNFFQDSTTDASHWRVVLNALGPTQRWSVRAPRFDETRHAGVCSELKFLYVSITRARKNIWIFDCSEKSEPMRIFWTAKGQVVNLSPENNFPSLGVSSTPEEWETSARYYFQKKRYAHAIQCFQRASLHREAEVANAYLLREQARATPSDPQDGSLTYRNAFTEAAEAFIKCAASATLEQQAYYRAAAECFEQNGSLPEAARAYVSAEEFDIAAQLYRDRGMFGHAAQVIRDYEGRMRGDVVDKIRLACRLYYFNKQDITRARNLFLSDEEGLKFVENYDFIDARVVFLVKLGRRADAADAYLSEGRKPEAIQLLLQDLKDDISIRRAIQYILSGLWENLPMYTVQKLKKTRRAVDELLRLATLVNDAKWNSSDRDEVSMFQAIARNPRDISRLLQLGRKFYMAGTNPTAALLCLDHVFSIPPQITTMSSQEVMATLSTLFNHVRLLKDIIRDGDPRHDQPLRKLLGIHLQSKNVFLIPIHTRLYQQLNEYRISSHSSNEDGICISGLELCELVKRSLRGRLQDTLLVAGPATEVENWPLSAALVFVRRIIHDQLSMDMSHLCSLVEHISGSLVISMSYQNWGTLHKVTLPRSWLLTHEKAFKEGDFKDTRLCSILVQPLAELLQQIYSGPRTRDQPPRHRLAFISRICRSLCLLGHNIPIIQLRMEILRAVTSLPNNPRLSSYLNQSYSQAQCWNHLAHAAHKSTLGYPEDELIQLYHDGEIQVPQSTILHGKCVRYKYIHEIPSLLANISGSPSVGHTAVASGNIPVVKSNAPEVEYEARSLVGGGVEALFEDNVQGRIAKMEFNDLSTTDLAAGAETGADPTGMALANDANIVASTEAQYAASVIQAAYRRSTLLRRRGATTSGLSAARARLFSSCLDEAQDIKWSFDRRYRMIYLGFLPHLLLCLEEVHKSLSLSKKSTKGRFLVAEHVELDELGRRQTDLVRALKKVKQLQKILEPNSSLHRNHDMAKLADSALEVKALVLRLPPAEMHAVEADLALAMKGIMT